MEPWSLLPAARGLPPGRPIAAHFAVRLGVQVHEARLRCEHSSSVRRPHGPVNAGLQQVESQNSSQISSVCTHRLSSAASVSEASSSVSEARVVSGGRVVAEAGEGS